MVMGSRMLLTAGALVLVSLLAAADAANATTGNATARPKLEPTTFILHTECGTVNSTFAAGSSEPGKIKHARVIFNDGTGEGNNFTYAQGLKMTEKKGSPGVFTLTTDKVIGKYWGFVVNHKEGFLSEVAAPAKEVLPKGVAGCSAMTPEELTVVRKVARPRALAGNTYEFAFASCVKSCPADASKKSKKPPPPCEGEQFCLMDAAALIVGAVSLAFALAGQKLHAFLVGVLALAIGVVAGFMLCDAIDPLLAMADAGGRDDVKWGVAVAIGIILWALVLYIESIIYSIVAAASCGVLTLLLFSILEEYVTLAGYWGFLAAAAAAAVGYFFLGAAFKSHMLVYIYAITGGLLGAGAVSYAFWRNGYGHGGMWVQNFAAASQGLNLGCWVNITCIVLGGVLALVGIVVQYKTAGEDGKNGDGADEKTPLLKEDQAEA